MKKLVLITIAICLLLETGYAAAQRGQRTNWNMKAPWGATRQDATRDSVPPYKIFDNVYYVGLQTVCAYLITTNAGLVLVDSTYAETADAVLNSVRTLGFNPADIKYVFVTHSHTDHLGGAAKFKQTTRAQAGISTNTGAPALTAPVAESKPVSNWVLGGAAVAVVLGLLWYFDG